MDASKKAEEYIKYGHWPGKKVKLTTQQWEEQVNHALYLLRDYIKNLSGFVPIRELINIKKEKYQLITDPGEVIFPEGINLETHCHTVHSKFKPYDSASKIGNNLFAWQTAFLTRKMRWVGWNNCVKSEFSFDERGKIVFRKDESFRSKFFALDLNDLQKWDASFGRYFIQHIRLSLVGGIHQGEKMIQRQRIILSEFDGIIDRIKEAVDY